MVPCAGKDEKQLEYITGGIAKCYSHSGSLAVYYKVKHTHLPYNSASLLIGLYL